MASNTIPISSNQLKNRRRELKTKRTLKSIFSISRTLLISGFAGGAFWLLTLPNWVIRSAEDINVEGNKLLSAQEIRSLIPLSYPQPLLTLSTEELTQKLKTKVPFDDVTINREMLPPKITVQVVEPQPVAIAWGMEINPQTRKPSITKLGYLDVKGILMPHKLYKNINEQKLPSRSFKITGIYEQYFPYWQNIYSLITQSEVKISEIDWQDPNNLILSTELGKVYLGSYTPRKFPQQLVLLAKMKQLPQKMPLNQIISIDLTDPELPSVKFVKPPKPETETLSEQD